MNFETLPGFRTFYPEDCFLRNYIFNIWRSSAHTYNFSEYDAPTLEPLELYKEKSGDEIVNQLFNFKDKGDRAGGQQEAADGLQEVGQLRLKHEQGGGQPM